MKTIQLILISLVVANVVLSSTTVDVTTIIEVDNAQQCDEKTVSEQIVPFGNQMVKVWLEHMTPNQRICVVKGAKITAAESGTLTLRENGKFMISVHGRAEINGTLSVLNYLVIYGGRLLIAQGAEVAMQTGMDVREGAIYGEVNFGGESKVNILGMLAVHKGGVLNLKGKSKLNVESLCELEISNLMFGDARSNYTQQYNLTAVVNCLDGCDIDLRPRSSLHVSPGGLLMVKNAEATFEPGASVSVQGEMEVTNGTSLSLSAQVLITYGNMISFAGQHSVVIKNSQLTVMYPNSGLYFRSDASIESKVIWVKEGAHCLFDPNGEFSANITSIDLTPLTKTESFQCYASKEELKSHL